ncbi:MULTISPECIES: hypothetical protein [unclassified Curtobacterium]|uniref:hypothetical protein n=1 Tax=unclassified Curtobacterium TaxID=257496 RepID=UPI0011B590DF|nr:MULTISPECIES: hypothetical protein [unclassified Curtobacterium]
MTIAEYFPSTTDTYLCFSAPSSFVHSTSTFVASFGADPDTVAVPALTSTFDDEAVTPSRLDGMLTNLEDDGLELETGKYQTFPASEL